MPDILTLIINCAEERLQFIIAGDLDPLLYQSLRVPGRAAGFLAPALQAAMMLLGIKPSDLSRLACVRGPGSFTGIRISLAAVQGLSLALDIPTAGLDYLPLLAHSAPGFTGSMYVVTHSRKGHVFVREFDAATMDAPAPASAVGIDELLPGIIARAEVGKVILLGGGIGRNEELSRIKHPNVTILPPVHDNPNPDVLLKFALNAEYSFTPIEPLYIRASDAEENLEAIALGRGLSPAQAERILHEEKQRSLT